MLLFAVRQSKQKAPQNVMSFGHEEGAFPLRDPRHVSSCCVGSSSAYMFAFSHAPARDVGRWVGKARACMPATLPSPDLATAATHPRLQENFPKIELNSEQTEQKCRGTENSSSFSNENFDPQKQQNPHGSMNDKRSVFMCVMPSRPGPQLVLVASFPGARVKDEPFN